MEKSLETLYKGKFSPLSQFIIFLAINIIAFGVAKSLQVDTNNTWVIFQTILFFFSTTTVAIGVFSKNHPFVYYPAIILLFIIFFTLSKRFPEWTTGVSVLEIPYLQNFVLLNILFFFIFLLASLIYRGAKQAFEKM